MSDDVSVQVQAFAIAFSTIVISVWQGFVPTISNASPPWLAIVLIALVTGVLVGGITLALGRRKINQIHRNLQDLKAQLEAVAQGSVSSATIDFSPEFMPLVSSIQQMADATKLKLNQAQEKVEIQARQNEYLEDKLMEIIRNLDLTDERNLLGDVITNEQEEENPTTQTGSLLEFLDNFHKWSQLPTAPELLLGSSSLEEIQQRKDQLQYRQVWLQAILEETQREIKLISPIAQLGQPNHLKKSNEG
jgi:outer membrane murein-binding lipoprotein Lpp